MPLITYQRLGYFALVFALIYAALAGFKTFFIISVVMAIYFLYSVPPIRFKKVFLLSKIVISLNSLLLFLLGFILVTDNVIHFPLALIPIYLIGFTLAANFIDIKDYAGDKAAHILTLPTVCGLVKTKRITGIAFIVTYLAFYFLLQSAVFLPLLLGAGIVEAYLINKKNYNEAAVFIFYLLSLMALICILILKHRGLA